ncbi:cellulase family glycosylhydrolase [Mycobacterium sp. 852014-52144_SCH5372336]|uniref:GH39 family glycosyl hydrolase n=1 Tax=Mycobacterium sp. 852014-52144_SCH5372336 TaxID=1834115 RepID=UPI001E5D7102|nr:cellulase family glycosylhydrolase [Mycobacterium sp. 852014-52144_SCH5372336]
MSVSAVEIGMTVHFRNADSAAIKRQFDLMADMGVTWVRVDIDWSAIERQRGQFNWTYPDAVAAEAEAHGMKVLAVLASSPEWARPSSPGDEWTSRHLRPDDMSDWADFVRTAVERYSSRGVHTWEIWNEPNTAKFWPPRPDANQYGTLFWVAAEAIRDVDPAATILIGGLAPKFDVPEPQTVSTDFLEQLYQNGAARLANGVAVHPYTFPDLPMSPIQRATGVFKDLPALHAVMVRHGDGHKKIWVTEYGAPTGTSQYAVSEEDQTRALLQAREQIAHWDWAGPLIYYELVDGGSDPSDFEQNFGVLRADLAPKPAAGALMDIAELKGSTR